MITSQVRAMMRRQAATLFDSTCVIEARTTETLDVMGAPVESYTQVYSGACRVIFAGAASQDRVDIIADRAQLTEQYRLIVPYDTALEVDQRVTVGSVVYTIVDVREDHTDAVDAQAVMYRSDA